jgi:hypothetical protein
MAALLLFFLTIIGAGGHSHSNAARQPMCLLAFSASLHPGAARQRRQDIESTAARLRRLTLQQNLE